MNSGIMSVQIQKGKPLINMCTIVTIIYTGYPTKMFPTFYDYTPALNRDILNFFNHVIDIFF